MLHFGLYCQTQEDSINGYLGEINKLVEEYDSHPEEFLNPDFLVSKVNRTEGAEKINVLLNLFISYIYKSSEKAEKYNEEALKLSEKLGYKEGFLKAQYNNAYLLFVKGNFERSLQLAHRTQKLPDYNTYPEIVADFSTLISDIYTERGEYDLALETGLKLLDKAEVSKNEYLFLRAYAALSHYYLRIENYSEALGYCLKGLHYILKLKETQYIFPKLDEIAGMKAKLNDVKKALEVYDFYHQIAKKIPSPGSYVESAVYTNMADIYMYNGKMEMAKNYLEDAMKMNLDNNYKFRIPRALTLRAKLALLQKDTILAIEKYEESINAAENINAFDVVKSNSLVLITLFKKIGLITKSDEYAKLHSILLDSLFTNEQEQKIKILEAKRRIKEITQKQRILELENSAQKSRYNTMVIVLIFILLLASISSFSYFKVKKKNRLLYKRTMELAEIHLQNNKKIQQHKNVENYSVTQNLDEGTKAKINKIDEDIKDIILAKLEKLEEMNFFLNPECTMRMVALQLKTNPKYLSQVINQEKEMNFNNYINELRINFLIKKLLEDKDFRESKLSYISASIGYNNLNTFNAAFKKRQGILPSYFISEMIQELERKRVIENKSST